MCVSVCEGGRGLRGGEVVRSESWRVELESWLMDRESWLMERESWLVERRDSVEHLANG